MICTSNAGSFVVRYSVPVKLAAAVPSCLRDVSFASATLGVRLREAVPCAFTRTAVPDSSSIQAPIIRGTQSRIPVGSVVVVVPVARRKTMPTAAWTGVVTRRRRRTPRYTHAFPTDPFHLQVDRSWRRTRRAIGGKRAGPTCARVPPTHGIARPATRTLFPTHAAGTDAADGGGGEGLVGDPALVDLAPHRGEAGVANLGDSGGGEWSHLARLAPAPDRDAVEEDRDGARVEAANGLVPGGNRHIGRCVVESVADCGVDVDLLHVGWDVIHGETDATRIK